MADAKNKFDYTKLNTLAVASLASAITLFGAPAAVLTGHISLAQLKDDNKQGRWMALTGLILGYVGIGLAILFTVIGIIARAKHGIGFDDDNQWQQNLFGDHNRFDGGYQPPMLPVPGTN